MSVKKVESDITTRFNYLVCLDIIVLACILVVAGRPDGLAITVSAIIIATGAVFYRCSIGVKSTMTSAKPPTADAGRRNIDRNFRPAAQRAPDQSDDRGSADRKSWLRESD